MMKKLLCTLVLMITTIGFVNAQTIEVSGLTVVIADGDTSPDVADDTQFPDTDIDGGSVVHTFTITNTGTALLSVGLDNLSNSTDFSQTTPPVPTDIATMETATFSVTFDPFDAIVPDKTSTVTVTIFNNDTFGNEPNYTFVVGGTATEVIPTPEPIIRAFGTPSLDVEIFDNDDASTSNGTDYGDVFTNSNQTNTFRISNDGDDDLVITNLLIPGGSSDFAIVEALSFPITITPGQDSEFNVLYTPGGAFASSATIFIAHNDNTPISLATFSIKLLGNGILAVPEIDVQGSGNTIDDGDNTPDPGDDTDFGQTDVDTGTIIHEFTILNIGNEDLDLTGSPTVQISGSADFTVTQQPALTTIAGPTGFTTFQITFDPSSSNSNPIQAVVTIVNNDSDEGSYTFTIEGDGMPNLPEMDVLDNGGLPLASGGSVDFGDADVSAETVEYTFTIENNGNADLILEDPSPYVSITGADSGDFILFIIPSNTITPSDNTTFAIRFNPSLPLGAKTATVSINNNDLDEGSYTFTLLGNGIDAGAGSPLLITQYYEGDDVANVNSWIEVKNISTGTVLPDAYHLALYEDSESTSGFIGTHQPTFHEGIPGLSPGEVVLFSRSGATLANLGPVTVIPTEVCRFDGNDVILISPSVGLDCYDLRIDILGVVGATAVTWGEDTALIKGCGTDEVPTIVYDPGLPSTNINYDPAQYIVLELTEVDNAIDDTNIQMGIQTVGAMIWGTSWGVGVDEIPDRTRDVIISGAYSGATLESCNLTVDGSISLNNVGSTNYVLVQENLTVNGAFTLGDTESLIMINSDAVINGSIDKEESTTALNNFRDFTFWSAPVSTTIGSAFPGVNINRIFEWDTANGEWDFVMESTDMVAAKGYIAEAPIGTTTHNVTFSGTPNNGLISIPVVFNNNANPDDDFNLIGNPYPSAIDIDKFIRNTPDNSEIQNGAMNGTIWLWTHHTAIVGNDFVGDDYASYNLTGGTGTGTGTGSGSGSGSTVIPDQYVGSGQGFFTKVESAGTLWFDNFMREKDKNDRFFRGSDTKNTVTEEKDRIWLNVKSSTGGAFNQLLVGFFDEATDGIDRGYDGDKVSAAWINFYSKIDDARYGIQGLSSFNVDKKVTLGFDTYIDQLMTYKMSIDNIEGVLNDNDVYIVDNELGITHDLKLADYEFEIDGSGNFPDRFTLQFTGAVLDIDNFNLNNDFIITNEENALQLSSSTVITNLKVYDMMGRLLIDSKPNDSKFSINTNTIKKGTVLILNATFDNGAEVSKKAIRY